METRSCDSDLFGDTRSSSTSFRIQSLYMFTIYNFVILIVHTVQCWSVLYTRHLLPVCLSCDFFPPLKRFFGKVSLIRIEGLRTEGVVCCTDCKAPWGKFVILSYMNKTDLTVKEYTCHFSPCKCCSWRESGENGLYSPSRPSSSVCCIPHTSSVVKCHHSSFTLWLISAVTGWHLAPPLLPWSAASYLLIQQAGPALLFCLRYQAPDRINMYGDRKHANLWQAWAPLRNTKTYDGMETWHNREPIRGRDRGH